MSQSSTGRHRAPSRLSLAGASLTRTAQVTAIAATSGGLVAAVAVPASAEPQADLASPIVSSVSSGQLAGQPEAAPQAGLAATPAVDLLATSLPAVVGAADKPARAVKAPKTIERDSAFGSLGFKGITPVVVVEEEPAATTSATSATTSTTSTSSSSTTSTRSSSSASRSTPRAKAPAPAPAPAPRGGGSVLSVAAAYTGIYYVYGGSTPSGFDCSGYTSWVYREALGIELPRSASGQQSFATPVSNPVPGDLVFWGYPAYHVGIYAGNGMVYDSGKPGIPTQLRPIFSGVSGYGRVG